jgi:hypothetical protein
MEDFRPGGKYATNNTKEGQDLAALTTILPSEAREELRRAAEVVAASALVAGSQTGLELGGLSSTMWSELLE